MAGKSSIRGVAMKGAGYYSKSTAGAKDVIDNATPLVLDTANAVPIPHDGRPITVADMGCADGGTSMEMIGKVLAALPGARPTRRSRWSTPTFPGMISASCSRTFTA